ncbi:hypothetical protein [Massilia sp. TS11]|uniref:hypothetical protein n=1 Tax=Massilia sp. TS11 TaxID=2908003 RepID=UPI001EDC68B3|nr:hypothetical protein [Massilia sp. TS11]MCG2584000.1 hypothetical protein [Massilia sp. TS11]
MSLLVMPPFLVFLLVVGAAGVMLGLSLLLRSKLVWRIAGTLNRWISFRRLLRPLEVSYDSWAVIERNRRLLALGMTVAAAYTLYVLWSVDIKLTAYAMSKRWGINPVGIDWLLRSFLVFMTGGNLIAILAGWVLALQPAWFAQFDKRASRWISTRKLFRSADAMNSSFDRIVAAWPRAAGGLIALFSIVEIVCVVRVLR